MLAIVEARLASWRVAPDSYARDPHSYKHFVSHGSNVVCDDLSGSIAQAVAAMNFSLCQNDPGSINFFENS